MPKPRSNDKFKKLKISLEKQKKRFKKKYEKQLRKDAKN